MTPAACVEGHRPSLQQARLWGLARHTGSAPYRVQTQIAIEGPLDEADVARAFLTLSRRHESLRTRLETLRGVGVPVQVIEAPAPGLPVRQDLCDLDPQAQVERLEALWDALLAAPLNTAAGSSLQAVLVRLTEDRHHLFLVLPAACGDRETLRQLVAELADCQAGAAPSDTPIQYADYAEWQQAVQTARGQEGADFWRAQLPHEGADLPLPFETPAPDTGEASAFDPRSVSRRLAPALCAALDHLAMAHDVPPESVVLGAFLVVLARHAGREERVIGLEVDGRNAELSGAAGAYARVVPMRVRVEPHASFGPWLAGLAAQSAEARAWQDAFEWPAEGTGVPYCRAGFAYHTRPEPIRVAGTDWIPVREHACLDRAVLRCTAGAGAAALTLGLTYDPQRITREATRCLLDQIESTLADAARDPETPIGALRLQGEAERRRVLASFRETGSASGTGELLHHPFEREAARRPEAAALAWQGQTHRYGELDRRANRLAHRLRAHRIGPERRVALLLGRGPALPVAILATLKAGGAYVPLDPAWPDSRLAELFDDAGVQLIVTETRHRARVPHGIEVLCLEDPSESWWSQGSSQGSSSACPPEVCIDPGHLAYVIYTSGSTGRPKGVAVEHAAAACSTAARFAYYAAPARAFLLLSPFAFDSSIAGFFWTLGQGGCLWLPSEEELRDPGRLAGLIEQGGISHLLGLPSVHRQLLDDGAQPDLAGAHGRAPLPYRPFLDGSGLDGAGERPGHLASLRAVIVAGEPCPPALVARHYETLPEVPLYNEYGPTEAVVWSSVERCVPGARTVPIGRPIRGARLYVLDPHQEPAAIGVPGELYIGGAGLARGYLGRPGASAERFLPDPYSVPGARFYRSGDFARWLPDGRLEYLGRADAQIKIRGYRIEPGEVEAALAALPEVAEAAVTGHPEDDGEPRLLAYVVVKPGHAPDLPALRAGLHARLPEHMLPARLMLIERLPRTATGKLDRRALPPPEALTREAIPYVAPRSPLEAGLTRLYGEVLRLERVGVHDGFFELGGDSILAMQLVGRARRAGLKVTARLVFAHPTIAALAQYVQYVQIHEGASRPPATERAWGEVPATPIQRWFFERELVNPERWTHGVLLAITEPLAPERLARAVTAVIAHHPTLCTRFVRGSAGWVQTEGGDGEATAFERVAPGAAGDWEKALEARMAIAIDGGCLLRATWFEGGPRGDLDHLFLVVHHLVADGLTWRILIEDLALAYRQITAGDPVALAPRGAAFRDWAERLWAYAQSPAVVAEADHWLARERRTAARLPIDDPEGANTEGVTEVRSVTLDPGATAALLRETARLGLGVEDVLLAALAETLARYTGSAALLLDLDRHGREPIFDDLEISRTVGWFTSVFPLFLRLDPESGPGAALGAVRTALSGVPHAGLHYGLLRYGDGEGARRLAEMPNAEVLFNYLGQLDLSFTGDIPFRLAEEAVRTGRDPRWPRAYVFAIGAEVYAGRLRVSWEYSRERHRDATITRLLDDYRSALEALIAHCRHAEPNQDLYTGAPDIEECYPATAVQAGMLFEERRAEGTGVYVQALSATLEGHLDRAALVGAWRAALRRYAVLRTAFREREDGRLMQWIQRAVSLPLDDDDWRDLPPAEQAARFATLVRAQRARGFEPGTAPLMRLTLVRLAEDRHRFLWTHHHALLDGWCPGLVLSEVLAAYESLRSGEPVRLPATRPYRDYIEWLMARDARAAESYFRRALAGLQAATALRIERPGAGRASGERHWTLSSDRTATLAAAARHAGVTPNTLVQGAYAILLARYSGERDIVFGVTVAGRPETLPGVETMVGLFINTLPLRVRVPDDAPVLGWLRGLMEQNAELREHQHVPLVEVQGWSEVPRGQPLFEAIVVFENYPETAALADYRGSLRIGEVEVAEDSHYPLALIAVPGERLRWRIAFDRGRYEEAAIQRLCGHLDTLLEGLCTRPEARLGELRMLTDPEHRALARRQGPALGLAPVTDTLTRRFEGVAARHAESPAVICEGEVLSYAALNARANRIAHRLRRRGAGPETRVGVYLRRGVSLPAAILGVLKSGAAYVPLDPEHPPARSAETLADAGAGWVVTESALSDRLAGGTWEAIALDHDADESAPYPEPRSLPENAAYVIYTSGSTGRPKGVVVTHANVLRLFDATAREFRFGPSDVWSLFHSSAFDFSVWEVFGALLHGGRLVIVPEPVVRSAHDFHRLLCDAGVTVLNQTPSAFYALDAADAESGQTLAALRLLVFGGEALDPGRLRDWCHRHPAGPRLVNMYGITETTVHVTLEPFTSAVAAATGQSPIGRTIADLEALVLDRAGNPVPIGVPGELHVGGPGLARGYLGRPGLTAACFVPHPRAPGARLYRSGDLASYREDGSLEYLGRIDRQVKVRGYRIEPGEIEARLCEHPEISAAAVVLHPEAGERRLLAYVVGRGALDATELRAWLKRHVPAYMLPAAFVFLEVLPRTANGKLDRARLPRPTAAPEQGYLAPRSPLEGVLAELFAEILGLARVGVEDDFFALGGHSLLAQQAIARIEGRFSVRLPMQALFEDPTVAALAEVLEATLIEHVERLGDEEVASLLA